ncbi:protein DGS1, mitochondrial-like [Triticum dicoccoides]|uniref:Protein DGS1, mitochondrial n=1 Tax=Triticum turgidum subsp. durum TaxID=4567 RepID=A0A9R0QWL5_TRITD|nr:protein DGS1, mitochondrial-like [Triticum dicoccoides]VAH17468.1 unnamed protein product [Triticum turgidum subsp. durum]
MATSPPRSPNSGDRPETTDLVVAAPAQPARIWNSLVARLPTLPNSLLLVAASDLLRRLLAVRRRRRRRRRPALPLPIYDDAASSARVSGEMPKAFAILEDIVQHTLSDLHSIQKSLLYWKSKAEGTNSHKMYFMMFERGPRAFLEATCQTLTRLRSNGSPSEYLLGSASDIVSVKLAVLTNMQHRLAAFLAEVYSEVDKCREGLTESSDKSLHTLFVILNTVFPKLEVSLTNASEGQTLPFTHDGNSSQLIFERLPEVDVESPQWSEALATDAISLIYQNLQKLDSFVSSQLSSHKKPRNMTIYWLPYTCGAIGLSACSLWLLRHSSLMGSSDMDNWIQDAKESVAGFWDEHVERPVISIRDELFETFKRTDKRVMEREEVQLTEESLHRMLITFCEQTSKEKLAQDASLQELLEIVMKRYEKESMHPIQNLFSGELARAMLIQVQKLKLDLQEAMLELDQILKANEINFAILAALPAFGLLLLLLFLVRAWAMHDQGAEGRGRIARHQRWQLLIEVERRLKEFKKCMINEMDEEASCKFGLTLYTLDRLYKAVEVHAKETGEWSSLRDDMFNLAKPNVGVADKLDVLKGLKWNYACLRPSLS